MTNFIEIPILESARLCHIPFTSEPHKEEVLAKCPFCGDEKKRFSMNTRNNQYQCFKCLAHGNSITLYANLAGVDNKRAYKLLTKGEYSHNPRGNSNQRYSAERNPRPLEDRHEIYYDLLEMCNLSLNHRESLLERGLDNRFINERMYKSVPNGLHANAIAEKLSKEHDLLGIPGFYRENDKWKMISAKGFFIPVLTKSGYIQGFQIRYDGDMKRRYRWFSSKGLENGTRAYGWYHITGWNGESSINLTEGALKGDIAYYFTGEPYLAIPGVKCISELIPTLMTHGITSVNECLDMDKFTNPDVKKQLIAIRKLLSQNGIKYYQNTWDSTYKGVDDFYKYMNGRHAA